MKFNHKPRAIIALTIAALLLMGMLALAAAPARASAASADSREPSPEPAPASSESSAELRTVNVSTVDEFLAAIAPDTSIVLAPGTYDLSKASNYGSVSEEIGYYRWEEVYDGYELVIDCVSNLSISARSDDPAATVISAVPRYADVLAFNDCDNIELSGFTAGHTKEQGQCAGGVLHMTGTDIVTVENCSLYGCGVLGVQAYNCRGIQVSDTDIYECSYGAVELTSCRTVQFDRCSFRDCSNRYGEPSPAYTLITIDTCYGVAITDGHVYGNHVYELVNARYSQEVCLLGTLFENNTVDAMDWYSGAVLTVTGDPIVVAGCEFRDDCAIYNSGEATAAADMDGNVLSYNDLASMKQEHVDFAGFAALETPELERTLGADGLYEVHVSNINEFLAAIAPNTTVYMDEGLYDLSKAAAYGGYGGEYYYWIDMYDGLGLVITGVENFSIVGAGKDATRIESTPRYADVILFEYCANVSVTGVTAGHTLGAGECVGAVLSFRRCVGVNVEECGLFGCGTFGVVAEESKNIAVKGNEIYQCSYGAVQLNICAGAEINDNDIHDCAYPTYGVYDSLDVAIDGKAVTETALSALTDYPLYLAQQIRETGSPILQEIVERGEIIFNENIDIPGAGPYKSAAQG